MLSVKQRWMLVTLLLSTAVAGIGNNLTFSVMGRRMQGVEMAPWLLYATALVYTSIYGIWMLLAKQPLQWATFGKAYLVQGFFITVPSICSQFSDDFVDSTLQQMLAIISLPGTFFGIYFFAQDSKHRVALSQVWGILLALVGLLLYAVAQAKMNGGFHQNTTVAGVIFFILGSLGASAVDVVQQRMVQHQQNTVEEQNNINIDKMSVLEAAAPSSVVVDDGFDARRSPLLPSLTAVTRPKVDLVPQLFVSNLVSIPVFVLSSLLMMGQSFGGYSFSQVLQQQRDAFKCFAQVSPYPPNCDHGAHAYVVAFIYYYSVYFWLQVYLVKMYGAIFQAVVIAIVTPGTTLLFWFPAFAGSPLDWSVWVSLVIVILGILIYIWMNPDDLESRSKDIPEADGNWGILFVTLFLSTFGLVFLAWYNP